MLHEPDRLDEDKEREEAEQTLGPCGCTDYHMADCPIRTARDDEYEPDYEQIIEGRAYMSGRDPKAVMWGGEDIPS